MTQSVEPGSALKDRGSLISNEAASTAELFGNPPFRLAAITEQPAFTSSGTRWRPMNPVAPVPTPRAVVIALDSHPPAAARRRIAPPSNAKQPPFFCNRDAFSLPTLPSALRIPLR